VLDTDVLAETAVVSVEAAGVSVEAAGVLVEAAGVLVEAADVEDAVSRRISSLISSTECPTSLRSTELIYRSKQHLRLESEESRLF